MAIYLSFGKSFNLFCASVLPSCNNEPAHTGTGSKLMTEVAGPGPALGRDQQRVKLFEVCQCNLIPKSVFPFKSAPCDPCSPAVFTSIQLHCSIPGTKGSPGQNTSLGLQLVKPDVPSLPFLQLNQPKPSLAGEMQLLSCPLYLPGGGWWGCVTQLIPVLIRQRSSTWALGGLGTSISPLSACAMCWCITE